MSTTATAEFGALAAADDLRCAHCGLDALPGESRCVDGALYCCAGCETAASILRQSGLDSGFYSLPERRNLRVAASQRSYAEFDHEAFQRVHVRARADGLHEVTLYLEGVHCASCVWLVERVPMIVPGAVRAELDVPRGVAHVEWDPAATTLSAIARTLDRLGYPPHAFRGRGADEARRAEERVMLTRIGVAGAIAANVMTIALALYSGVFGGMAREFETYFRWLSFALVTPAMLWPGRVFFTSAWQALRNGGLHMDVPIAAALAVGYAQGTFNTFRDSGPIYFDAVGTLIFLLLLGRYLQHRAQRSAADSAALLGALTPTTARVVEGDSVRELPTEAVLPGMELEVRAGDTLAADGSVLRGHSSLDLALLTGESRPVSVGEGDRVFAGTVNLSHPLRVRVEEAGITSRLGRLLRDVEDGARERPPVVLLADRLAGWFIAAVLALAVTTAALWWGRDQATAIDNAIAMLVVTCPCALAMATPLTFTVAIGRAAARGILIKGAHALETLDKPGTLFLDKTGTLTTGQMLLEQMDGDEAVRPLVVALERHSRHPVAAAVLAAMDDGAALEAHGVRETLGGGLRGIVAGHEVVVGRPAWVEREVGRSAAARREFAPLNPRLTPVLVAVDGEIVARLAFGDPLRAEAPDAVRALQRRGWQVRLLSGDAPEVVAAVAEALGIAAADAEGGASPERKREAVRAARQHGHVVMVGDGVNDAAAIATATVGIAVRGGAEASMAAADVYLARGGIAALQELVQGARRTTGIIERNVLLALGYNLIGVTLAVMGVIDPLFAAILMPLSSLTVVLGAWQGRTFSRAAA
ncbi:MAG: heavy metal translocating P-type ATPase metal-binding domain-containing protein [Gemmatimonadaceae bacterium]|nr:heavy metal translocating P-type ATPase metal-binding domain-containing protein [Gemmatimonadaceae bacterium]